MPLFLSMKKLFSTLIYGVIVVVSMMIFDSARADELKTYKLEIKDGVFTPLNIEVPAKTKIKIEITNTGKTAAEFESVELRKEKVLGPGVTSFVVIAPLRPGEYPFFDDFHLDMPKGKIIVK